MTRKRKKYVNKHNKKCYVVERAFGHSSALPTFGDADGDGVPNFFDCQPKNPYKDGILRDVGEAVATRVKHEVSDVKEHVIEEIAGEKKRAERLEIEKTEEEAYLRERKKAVEEEARIKARARIERHKEAEEERKTRRREAVREEAEARRAFQRRPKHSTGISKESIYSLKHSPTKPRARKTEEHIPYTRRRIYT